MTFSAIFDFQVFAVFDQIIWKNQIKTCVKCSFLEKKNYAWKDYNSVKRARNLPYLLLSKKLLFKVAFPRLFLLTSQKTVTTDAKKFKAWIVTLSYFSDRELEQ